MTNRCAPARPSPAILELDPYSGDFGIGFFGHGLLAASIYVEHPLHGPLCFLCDIATKAAPSARVPGAAVHVITQRDSVRRRLFIEPMGALIELDAGAITSATFDATAWTV